MSEPHIGTGKKRTVACAKCGDRVLQTESVGAYGGGAVWTTAQHLAPCGAYCWGAGVPPRAYRERRLHGFDGYPCPECLLREVERPLAVGEEEK